MKCSSDLEFTAGQHVRLSSELLACEFPRDSLQKHPQGEGPAGDTNSAVCVWNQGSAGSGGVPPAMAVNIPTYWLIHLHKHT